MATIKFADALGNVYDTGIEQPNDPDFDYTPEQEAVIQRVFSTIESSSVPMAVVDYGSDCRPKDRFGVRDMRHVAVYRLDVVQLNRAASTGKGEF